MWISRAHYDQLCNRLDECERQIRASKIFINKWPDDKGSWSNRYFELMPSDALDQLATHLGVEFVYRRGTPDSAVLTKLKK